MKMETLFSDLESVRFAAQVNAASSHRIFQRALEQSTDVQALLAHLQRNPQDGGQVFERLRALLQVNDKPGYLHPYDATIAAYLFVLSKHDYCLGLGAAQSVLRTPRLWWAKRLAERLLPELEVAFLESNSKTTYAKVNFTTQTGKLQPKPGALSISSESGGVEEVWLSAFPCERLVFNSGHKAGVALKKVEVG